MILQALAALTAREGLVDDPDYESRPVAWLVRLTPEGQLIAIEGTHQSADGRRGETLRFRVPRSPTGRSGTRAPARFLVDNAKYVFGLPTPDITHFDAGAWRKAATRFLAQVQACAEATRDEGVTAVRAFLERVAAQPAVVPIPPMAKANEEFAFLLGAGREFVHDRPEVQAYWRQRRSAGERPDRAPSRTCLVSGRPVHEAVLMPLVKRVPGKGTGTGVAAVSFNAGAFLSHGWKGNENAPLSRSVAEAASTALNRLLDMNTCDPRRPGQKLPRRRLDITGDTTLLYWSTSGGDTEFIDFLNESLTVPDDPERVPEIYRSVWRGTPPPAIDPAPFFAVTLSGSQGRLIVRDWFETTVAQVAHNVARYFADLQIVRNTPYKKRPEPPAFSLRALTTAIAPRGAMDAAPTTLSAALLRVALAGGRYPTGLLQCALLRARAESSGASWADSARRDARAALLKAILTRTFNMEVHVTMDPENVQPGYLLGRLMAVIERMQQAALGGDLNATVVDRYFSGASASPASVFPRLMKGLRHYARKAKDDERTGGMARWLDGEVDSIVVGLTEGFPAFLDLQQQGLFVIGYHHERHRLSRPREARDRSDAPAASES